MNTFTILGLIGSLVTGGITGYNGKRSAAFIVIVACLSMTFLFYGVHVDEPTAMDVYRGKTTLEITYKDSIAVDSVVVFKEKKNKEKRTEQ